MAQDDGYVDIHSIVQERYGSIARSQGSESASCCGSSSSSSCCGMESSSCGGDLYSAEMLDGLPVDVTGLSLGCEGTQFTRSNTSCCAS